MYTLPLCYAAERAGQDPVALVTAILTTIYGTPDDKNRMTVDRTVPDATNDPFTINSSLYLEYNFLNQNDDFIVHFMGNWFRSNGMELKAITSEVKWLVRILFLIKRASKKREFIPSIFRTYGNYLQRYKDKEMAESILAHVVNLQATADKLDNAKGQPESYAADVKSYVDFLTNFISSHARSFLGRLWTIFEKSYQCYRAQKGSP